MTPEEIFRIILSVQPMDEAGKAFAELYKQAKSESELIKEGYEPVCPETRLMWRKRITPSKDLGEVR